MVVEPEYRGRNVGALAVEAIACLHGADVAGCDCTILVANDKTGNDDQRLVQWHTRRCGGTRVGAGTRGLRNCNEP